MNPKDISAIRAEFMELAAELIKLHNAEECWEAARMAEQVAAAARNLGLANQARCLHVRATIHTAFASEARELELYGGTNEDLELDPIEGDPIDDDVPF